MKTNAAARILVVDDEVDTCANLSDILSDLGYEVDVAYDGLGALELVNQKTYDVALLDLKMPGMNGLELYRRIKQLEAGTVAIVVSHGIREQQRGRRRAGRGRVEDRIEAGQFEQAVGVCRRSRRPANRADRRR